MSAAPPVPAPAPVYTREVAPGVSINSGMTPQERFAIVAKAHGAEVNAPKAGPQAHTQATLEEFNRRDKEAAERAAPAPGAAPQPTARQKIDAFHADMHAAGLAVAPPVPINDGPDQVSL